MCVESSDQEKYDTLSTCFPSEVVEEATRALLHLINQFIDTLKRHNQAMDDERNAE